MPTVERTAGVCSATEKVSQRWTNGVKHKKILQRESHEYIPNGTPRQPFLSPAASEDFERRCPLVCANTFWALTAVISYYVKKKKKEKKKQKERDGDALCVTLHWNSRLYIPQPEKNKKKPKRTVLL